MKSGILSSWYMSRIAKSKTPIEYFFTVQEFMIYELSVLAFNVKEYFHHSL